MRTACDREHVSEKNCVYPDLEEGERGDVHLFSRVHSGGICGRTLQKIHTSVQVSQISRAKHYMKTQTGIWTQDDLYSFIEYKLLKSLIQFSQGKIML